MFERSRTRVTEAAERVGAWAGDRDPGSASGVAIGAWRRYRAVEGPLQSALLSLYILVAVIPALLAIEAYLDSHPAALAERLAHHYDLSAPTATLLRQRRRMRVEVRLDREQCRDDRHEDVEREQRRLQRRLDRPIVPPSADRNPLGRARILPVDPVTPAL